MGQQESHPPAGWLSLAAGGLRYAGLLVILLLLPLAALWWGIGQAEDAMRQRQLAETEEELSELGARLVKTAAPSPHFQELLERVVRSFVWKTPQKPLLAQFPPGTRLFLFDAQGQRVNRDGFQTDLVVISQRYLDALRRVASDPTYLMTRNDKMAGDSFVGDAESLLVIGRNPGRLCDLTTVGVGRLGGWFPIRHRDGRQGHLLALLEGGKVPHRGLVKRAVERLQKLAGPPFRFAWLSMERPLVNGNGQGRRLSRKILPLLSRPRLPRTFRLEGSLFAVGYLPSGFRLISCRPVPPLSTQFTGLRLMLAVVLVEALLVAFWHTIYGVSLGLTVRAQLIGIFGLAGLASLGALIGVSQAYREARQEALIRESRQNALRIMEKIDGNFTSAFSYLLREYRGFSRALEADPASFAAILEPLRKARSEGLLEAVCLVDRSGKPCFRIPADDSLGTNSIAQNTARLLANLGVQVLRKYNSEQPDQDRGPSNSMFSVLMDRPIDDLIKNRAGLQPVSIAGEEKSTFVDLAFDQDGKALYCLMILHDRKALQTRHLRTVQGIFQRQSPFQLLAFPRRETSGVVALGHPRSLKARAVVQLQDLVGQTQAVGHRRGRLERDEVLLSAMPGRNLRDFNLALVTPFGPIAEKARAISRSFLALAFGSVLFTLFLSLLLADSLLNPIRELAAGIENLTSLRLDHPVDLRTGDELEEIGKGLNAVLLDMQEIALARTVQEQLLPSEPIQVGRAACRGWMRPSSDVGGELFDFLALPEGRLAFLLVDVSGQGISSALVMAMCKMALRLHLEMEALSPAAILKALDQHLRMHVRRLANVVVFLGVVDPPAGTLTYAGGGGCVPFLLAENRAAEILPLGREGLGGQAYPELADRALELGAGTRVVVCTDGLAQVATNGGVVLGVGGLVLVLERVRGQPWETLGTSIFQQVDEFAQGAPRPADQTLVVLELRAEEGKA